MKILYLFFSRTSLATSILFLFAFSKTSGQDIIVKNNGDELKAKVEEVQDNEIKYRKYDNLSGPLYSLKKAEIFMIKYENGSKDVFGSGVQDQTGIKASASQPGSPAIIYFYRPSKFMGSSPEITVGTAIPDEVIVHLRNGHWHRSEYSNLGQRELITGVYSISDKKLSVNFESGKTYYIRCSIKQGMGVQSQVEMVDEETGKREMAGLKEQEKAIVK